MAAKNTVTLSFVGDASKLQKASDQAKAAAKGVGDQVEKGAKQFGAAGKIAKGYESTMTKVGVAVIASESAFNLAGSALSGLNDLQHRGERNAIDLARAQGEVEQASLDAEQATIDLRQATEDLAQAQLDTKQAARDVAQSQLDVEQSMLDAEDAAQAYRDAVKEHGKGSLEARQALLDLKQAGEDTKQAQLDLEQATADSRQATIDQSQAMNDAIQAQRDSADAALDLREAQLGIENPDMTQWTNGLSAAAQAATLLAVSTDVLKFSTIKATAATAASKAATVVGTAATGVATAAQWLWNAALSANPIGLVIVAIGALVAAVVWIATKTTWFQDLWSWVWGGIGGPVKAAWDWIRSVSVKAFNWIVGLPGKIGDAFSSVRELISRPFRAAFNLAADAWNNTVGKLSWTVPDWVPFGLGGKSISAPRLPHFHTGISRVPGLPGQEVLSVLKAGETVTSAGGGAAERPVEIHIYGDLKGAIRKIVRVDGRGSVQTAFGG